MPGGRRFVGVTWDGKSGVWLSNVYYNKRQHFCGAWNAKLLAAHAVNIKCLEFKIPQKNPHIYGVAAQGAPEEEQ